MTSIKPSHLLKIILVIVTGLVILVYAYALGHGFVNFDDQEILINNTDVLRFRLSRIFFHSSASDYIPLTLLSFAIENALFGLNPFVFHFDNILLHLLNSLLVTLLIYRISSKNLFVTCLSGILFAIHPMHVESVAWVTERKDVLCTFFFLICCHMYLSKRLRLCFLFFIFALLSKALAVTLPAVLILFDYLNNRKLSWPTWLEKAPFFLTSVIYLPTYIYIAHETTGSGRRPTSLWLPLIDGFNSVVHYTAKLIVPTKLAAYYGREAVNIPITDYILAIAIIAILLVCAKLMKEWRRHIIFGATFYILTLSPVLRFLSFGSDFIFADRYVYIPSIGLFYSLGFILSGYFSKNHKMAIAVLVLITVVFSPMANGNVKIWKETEILWRDVLSKFPGTSFAHNDLGNALGTKGKDQEAVEEFKEALRINPELVEGEFNYANILTRQGKIEEAIGHYKKVLEITPQFKGGHNNLGIAYDKLGKPEDAIAQFKEALEIDANQSEIHNNMGIALNKVGKPQEAADHFAQALQIDPYSLAAEVNMGISLTQEGKTDEAISHLNRALKIKPDSGQVHYNLGAALLREGKITEAEAEYDQGLKQSPELIGVEFNFANLLARQGKLKDAVPHYKNVLRSNPKLEGGYNNLGITYDKLGMTAEAIAQYEEVLKINPRNSEAHTNLGVALDKQGKTKEALTHYKEALRIDPQSLGAHYNLALSYSLLGNKTEALKEYQQVKTINPDVAKALKAKISK